MIKKDWWRGLVVYQIYPRSYKDTSGNGIGDINGIIDKLDYVAQLGVDAIWVSPFYPSPMKDFGYDVMDYCDIDPMFGDLNAFDAMMDKAHKLGIKVIIDLVLSHSSDQHPWFKESRSSRDNPKADWYVWADPKEDGSPPNNWLSIFGGPSWQWDTTRRQYYFHNFLTSQPDINFHCQEATDALLEVAKFWLDRGVDGFRLDTVNLFTHDKQLRDNPPIEPGQVVQGMDQNNPLAMQNPIYSATRPENLVFLRRLRALLEQYENRATIGEISMGTDQVAIMSEYTQGNDLLHMCYVFDFLTPKFSPSFIRNRAKEILDRTGDGWCVWAVSNHDIARVASRWNLPGDKAPAVICAMMSSLRGSVTMYQGEELGLPDADVPFELLQDPYGIEFWPEYKGRDGCRTPMPWTNEKHGGFTTADPWLPVPQEHIDLNAAGQEQQANSTLKRTREFFNWRAKQDVLRFGEIDFLPESNQIVGFVRYDEQSKMMCLFNLSGDSASIDTGAYKPVEVMQTGTFDAPPVIESQRITVEPWSATFVRCD